jgi:hypothetical protein
MRGTVEYSRRCRRLDGRTPTRMPIFLDSHQGSELPLDGVRAFLRAARSSAADEFGVRPLDLYCGDDGRVFFVVSAPDEAAVRRQHTHQGVVCRRVRRVQSIVTGGDELGDDQKAIVRSMIVAEQTVSPGVSNLTPGDERLRQVG